MPLKKCKKTKILIRGIQRVNIRYKPNLFFIRNLLFLKGIKLLSNKYHFQKKDFIPLFSENGRRERYTQKTKLKKAEIAIFLPVASSWRHE